MSLGRAQAALVLDGGFPADLSAAVGACDMLRRMDLPERCDFLIAGCGAAGLSLALRLCASEQLSGRPLVLIDRDSKDRDDRTFSFWTREPTFFDDSLSGSFAVLELVGADARQRVPLRGGYRYQTLRGIDLYRRAKAELRLRPNVTWLQGTVEHIEDGPTEATIIVDGRPLHAAWVFDSRRPHLAVAPRYHDLAQHFLGWEVEAAAPTFDPQVATLFDFRVSQEGELRFFYTIPFSDRRALVEQVWLSNIHDEAALRAHCDGVLGLRDYRVIRSERGISPLTDQPFPRRAGRRVMNIGVRGGRVKPTSGYAFTRIQRDAAATVASLEAHGHPFAVPRSPWHYRLCDALFLQVMERRGAAVAGLLCQLFARNPVDRVLRFLDEEGSLWETLRIAASLPAAPFLRALGPLALRRAFIPGRPALPPA